MSHRQLEQLRQTLDGLVADIEQREDDFQAQRNQLGTWADELKARELRLEAEAAASQSRQAADSALAERLDQLTAIVGDLAASLNRSSVPNSQELATIIGRQVHEQLDATLQTIVKSQLAPILAGIGSGNQATRAGDVDRAVQQGLKRELTTASAERDRLKRELIEMEALLNEAMEGASLPELIAPSRSALLDELAAAKVEQARLAEALSQASAAAATADDEGQTQLLALQAEVETLRELLRTATAESAAHADAADAAATEACADNVAAEQLREELERASCEIIDLRTQKEELELQVAQLQVCTAPHGHMPHLGTEGLSWEERKRLLILQLDAEDDDGDEELQRAKFEVQDIIASTEYEIGRRDREIAELRELLAQQAEAQSGIAIGAAAVAEMIESDELIRQERERLREIQQSWEEKLRQAEIDLSMERAKLARERSQLEEKLKELESLHITDEERDELPGSKERRWLKQLGLRDEK